MLRYANVSAGRTEHRYAASVVNPEIIQHYHAHVYYDPASRGYERAWQLPSRVRRLGDGTTRRSGPIHNRCIRLLSRPHCWPLFCRG
jgi:hypothetical protein